MESKDQKEQSEILVDNDALISKAMSALASRRWANTTKKEKQAMTKRFSAMGKKSRENLTAKQRKAIARKGGLARARKAKEKREAEEKKQ